MASFTPLSEVDLRLNLTSTMENTFSRTFLNPNAEQMNLLSSDTDIKNDFQIVLEEGLDKEVHFASVERYAGENAPEPHLAVSGLRFNFPLTEPDACALISVCVPQRTVAHRRGCVIPGVWEATSSEVHFNNPAWERWIRDVAGPTALRGLRADCQPEYVFRKLVVHETGSQLMKLVEVEPTQNSPPKIGNLVVLLPSLFAGGNLELRHDGQSKQIDQSNLLTSVVAAYSGVEQSLSAVSAGYRLSLLYDIVHRGVRPPTLADLERPKQKLRWIMSAWKEDLSGSAPQFLACLLQRKYFPSVTFDASSLIGDDGLLLSVLRPLAQELQFSLHLVHFEVNVTVHDSQTQGYDESFSSAWVEEESICMGEESFDSIVTDDGDVEDHQVVITKIHDLEGIPVNVEGLKIATRDLINGRNVTLNEPESESVDEYGRRTKKYSHTGLLIWPESTAGLRVSVGDVYELACNALGGSVSATPTDKENHLVEKLIQWCSTAHQDPRLQQTAYLLSQCAERWCNFGIFFRAMGACGVDKNIALIGPEGLVSAYQAFEWRDFSYFCTIVVTSDPSNTNRWALIMHLSQMATAEGVLEVQRWCQGHQSNLLRSLDLESLVELIIWGGGEFLKDIIYPQLMIQWPSEANLWGLFFQQLYQSRGQIPCVDPDSVSAVINHGVGGIVMRLPAFPRCTVDGQEQANFRAVLDVVYLCLETDQVALCASIAQKMWGSGDYSPQFPPWIYYVGIACDLEGYFEADPGRSVLAPALSPFFENTVVSLLSPRGWPSDGPAFPYSLTRPVLAAVMKAAKRVGGAFFLRELWSHQPEMLHHLRTDTLQELGRSVFTYLRPSDDLLAYTEYAALVNLVVDAAVDTFDINYEGNALCGGYSGFVILVNFCLDVGAPNTTYERFLARLLPAPHGTSIAEHVAGVLIPLLLRLRWNLSCRNLDLRIDGFSTFSAIVVKSFVDNHMPRRPPGFVPVERLQEIGCFEEQCKVCPDLRTFVLDKRATIQFKHREQIRNHIEKEAGVLKSLGFTRETIKGRTPYTLVITKPQNMVEFGIWYQAHVLGERVLGLLGSTEALREILGQDYDGVLARIEGMDATARPPLASLGVNTGQNRGQAMVEPLGNMRKKPRLL